MKNKISESQKQHIIALYAANETPINEIARATGLSRRSIGRILVSVGLKGEPLKQMDQIMRLLKAYKLEDVDKLYVALAFLDQDKSNVVRDYVVGLDDPAYQKFLAEVIHKREAKRFNSSVSNAMLQLSKKANNGPSKQ